MCTISMNDDNEIIELECDSCGGSIKGTYFQLFGDLPSIVCLPELICTCGGSVSLSFTGHHHMPHFDQAKEIVKTWPKWKQDIKRFPGRINDEGN